MKGSGIKDFTKGSITKGLITFALPLFLSNLLQVVYATAAGFMFVMIYRKSKSLTVCIAAHGIFNAMSVFANEASATIGTKILTAVLLTVITGAYAIYLAYAHKTENK